MRILSYVRLGKLFIVWRKNSKVNSIIFQVDIYYTNLGTIQYIFTYDVHDSLIFTNWKWTSENKQCQCDSNPTFLWFWNYSVNLVQSSVHYTSHQSLSSGELTFLFLLDTVIHCLSFQHQPKETVKFIKVQSANHLNLRLTCFLCHWSIGSETNSQLLPSSTIYFFIQICIHCSNFLDYSSDWTIWTM